MEHIPYKLHDSETLGSIRDRRSNCLAHVLNTAIYRGDISPTDAYGIYQEVVDSDHLDTTPLPATSDLDDTWLGMRDPCQDLNRDPR